MANETNSIMNFKDDNGVNHEIYPVTKIENVEGLSNALDAKANADTVSTLANTVSAKADASALASKVDKVSGKGLSTNDYTTAEKNKLASVAEGANKTTTDTSLSSTSGNPIANKTVYTALAAKADSTALASVSNSIDTKISAAIDKLIDGAPETYDTLKEIADYLATHQNEYTALLTTIAGKVDKVTGKGLSTEDFTSALKTKLDGIATGANKTTVDTALSSTSGNPVANSAVNTALGNKVDKVSGKGLSTNDYTTAEKNKLAGIAAGANAYSLPTASSSVLGGVKTGSNITNSSGTISITKGNVTDALGYVPPTKDTTYNVATTSVPGLMSTLDKSKLDGVETGANKTVVDTTLGTSGNPIANSAVNTAVSSLNTSVSTLNTGLASANARIDTFTNLKAGSTTGDAELIDGRVGADGKTYTNIGGAIRGQITDLKETVFVNKKKIELIKGYYIDPNKGYSIAYTGWDRTEYIDITSNKGLYYSSPAKLTYCAWFDDNAKYIKGATLPAAPMGFIASPANAKYICVSGEATNMERFKIYNNTPEKCDVVDVDVEGSVDITNDGNVTTVDVKATSLIYSMIGYTNSTGFSDTTYIVPSWNVLAFDKFTRTLSVMDYDEFNSKDGLFPLVISVRDNVYGAWSKYFRLATKKNFRTVDRKIEIINSTITLTKQGYLNPNGAIKSSNDYLYSSPILIEANTAICVHSYEMTGMCVVAKAKNDSDDGSEGYTPIYTKPSGEEWESDKYYYIAETGYYVVSAYKDYTITTTKIGLKYEVAKREYEINNIKKGTTSDELGEYYSDYIKDKVRKITNNIMDASARSDSFVFLTDTHFPSNSGQSGKIAAKILDETFVNKVVMGGDVCPAYKTAFADSVSAKSTINRAIIEQKKALDKYLTNGNLYQIKGNHDFTVKTSASETGGYTYSEPSLRTAIMADMDNYGNVVTNDADPNACYYYIDNSRAKIRYIMFDFYDTANSGDVGWGVIGGVHNTQLNWIANAMLTAPTGYNFVCFSHSNINDVPSTGGDYSAYSNVKSLLKAVQEKGTYSSFDFAAVTGKVLAIITGHEHQDIATYVDGILNYTVACDANYKDYKKSPVAKHFGINIPDKTWKTIYEQTLDVITVDAEKNLVIAERIGGADNKKFHIDKHAVNVGSSVTLTSTLSGTVTWWSYDSTGRTVDSSYNVTLKHTVVSNSNGLVTGLKSGEAVVVACNGIDTEYFYVKVN